MSPTLVLVGPPGAGKSTVAALLARRLGCEVADTDALIAAHAGSAISDIFVDQGEGEFRRLEREITGECLSRSTGVVSLGGGGPMQAEIEDALAGLPVVFLDVGIADAARRIGFDTSRPLLAVNPRASWIAMMGQRRGTYERVARWRVDTSGRNPDEVTAEIETLLRSAAAAEPPGSASVGGPPGPVPVRIAVGDSYEVVLGRRLLDSLPTMLPAGVRQVLLVHTASTQEPADAVRAVLTEAGLVVSACVVPDAEAAKTDTVATSLWAELGRLAFTRSDAVVAIGGGAVTDLAGFVAATWLRGIAVVHVPTTVLGMVDAAVGGKTGINTPQGKNLVGAFHPPAGVLCDLALLDTLPETDVRAGLAEVVKGGFIADPGIIDLIEGDPIGALDATSATFADIVRRKITVKAHVVGQDLTESGLREILNYGHTFGHAVEQVEGFRMRHGEAVAIGMMYVAHLAHGRGLIDDELLERHARVLDLLDLPRRYRSDRWDELMTAMRRDKKSRGATLRFVVLEGLARPTRLVDPDTDELKRAYRSVTGA